LFTTPVVYLYLDKLSNAFSRWGRSKDDDDSHLPEHGAVKEAAE
jgi:HAE1 family hydrophobic/amphiphilic exporter-1